MSKPDSLRTRYESFGGLLELIIVLDIQAIQPQGQIPMFWWAVWTGVFPIRFLLEIICIQAWRP